MSDKSKKKIFEKLWKLNQKMKIVPYFNNCNRIFFFKAKVLNIWLQIWLPFELHAEGATCQRGEVLFSECLAMSTINIDQGIHLEKKSE